MKAKVGLMLKFMEGKVYWLQHHYRYTDPEDAKMVLLGNGQPMKGSRDSNRTKGAKIIYIS